MTTVWSRKNDGHNKEREKGRNQKWKKNELWEDRIKLRVSIQRIRYWQKKEEKIRRSRREKDWGK